MRVAERATPVAAVFAALATLACCLPLSIAGAAGLSALAAWAGPYRFWLLGVAGALLIAGFVHLYLRGKQCQRRSRASVVLFWVSAAIVMTVIFFPQVIASLLAG